MGRRTDLLNSFYNAYDEDRRLEKSRHGQLEYAVTMHYIHRFLTPGAKVLEVGAGTGRYSIALAGEGTDVTSVELVEKNLAILREKSRDMGNIRSYQGDAADLGRFADDTFDLTLVLGPLYHLFEPQDIHKAIDEAIRVTKKNGVLFFAFISVFGIMYNDYFKGNWSQGQEENFTDAYRVRHFEGQIFTGYDVAEFEGLFAGKPVEWITTTGTDGMIGPVERRSDFVMTDEDFALFTDWYLHFSEKRELLGNTVHLLYICRKK